MQEPIDRSGRINTPPVQPPAPSFDLDTPVTPSPSLKPDLEAIAEKIPPALMRRYLVIAQRVAADWGMEVELGKPGEGSFCQTSGTKSVITLDPLHLLADPDTALFVPGHEAAHAAITLDLKSIALTEEQIGARYQQIGYGYTMNVVEDAAVNSWLRDTWPGFEQIVQNVYDPQFAKQNAVLSTPEMRRLASSLGFTPRFIQYGSECLRDWHTGTFSSNLDPLVRKTLELTISEMRNACVSIPAPGRDSRRDREAAFKQRFETVDELIWPAVKLLVEEDLNQANQSKLGSELSETHRKMSEKAEELKEAQQRGDKGAETQLKQEIEGLQEQLDQLSKASGIKPEDLQKAMGEMSEKRDQQIRENAEKMAQELKELQDKISGEQSRQEDLKKQMEELKEQLKQQGGGTTAQKEELEKLEQELTASQAREALSAKKLEQAGKLKFGMDAQSSSGESPVPIDKLSKETQEALKKLFEALPKGKKDEIKAKSEFEMKELEDALNEELRSKTSSGETHSHKEQVRDTEEAKQNTAKAAAANLGGVTATAALRERRLAALDDWEKAYAVVASQVNKAYTRLRRTLIPNQSPDLEGGRPTGVRLDVQAAMQSEADIRLATKIWQRRAIPMELDFRFEILVDVSGSMKDDGKADETFKGLVLVCELLEKLHVPYRVTAFGSNIYPLKDDWQKLHFPGIREKLASVLRSNDNATNDAKALGHCYPKLAQCPEGHKFLLVFSDAGSGEGADLSALVEVIRNDPRVLLLHYGIGPGTIDENGYYDISKGGLAIAATPEERRAGAEVFSEVLPEMLEDMIHNPGKYLSGKKLPKKGFVSNISKEQGVQAIAAALQPIDESKKENEK